MKVEFRDPYGQQLPFDNARDARSECMNSQWRGPG